MVQAKDLRIGNKVIGNNIHEGRILTVCEIEKDLHHTNLIFFDEVNGVGEWIADIKPIELTPDILLKCGFVLKNGQDFNYYVHPGCDIFELIEMTDKPNEYSHVWDTAFTGIVIKHLHHLQNVIHALTGQELTVDTTPNTP